MSVDLQNSLNDIKSRISALKVTNQVLKNVEQKKKELKDNLEKQEQKVIDALDKVEQEKKRFKRQIEGQLGNLLDIFQMSSGNGLNSTQYVKSRFVEILNRMQPVMQRLIKEVMIGCIGCSQDQQYDPQTPIYIKLSSIDLSSQIKNFRPDVEEGAILYESRPAVLNQFPYSMNREIWNRTQKIGQTFSTDYGSNFVGKSGQQLFDMEYTQTDNNGIPGDYLKVTLSSRLNNLNNVTTFLQDYYSSINVLDLNSVYTRLMEILTGAISINASIGSGEVQIQNKVALIIQRILGLCYDARNEIDVSGVSKIPELDGVDESFFEFSSVDQRLIDQLVTNTSNGVVEFEDCDNIKLPVDPKPIIKALSEITFNDGTNNLDNLDRLGKGLLDPLINNPEWKLRFPNSFNFELKLNTDFILKLPISLVMSLLSPKVLLPIFIMFKAIGNNLSDLIENFVDFFKKFKKCLLKLVSKIGALFIRELFTMIKRDILQLLSRMVREISKEKVAKKYILIAKLVAILAVLVKAFIDWRKCKSVLDEILLILNIIMLGRGGPNGVGISPLLLAQAGSLPGYSSIRSLSNQIEEYERLGLPTGPMPDGSPNLNLLAMKAQLDGDQKEKLNQKGAAFIPPLATGVFVTQPTSISVIPDT